MLGNRVWATFTCNCTCVYDVAFFWYIAFLDIPYVVPRVRCHRMRPISTGGVAWSVTCVDNHDREPCRNGWTDRDAAWSRVVSSGLKEPCIKCRCILASPGEYGCTIRAPKMWTVRWPRQLIRGLLNTDNATCTRLLSQSHEMMKWPGIPPGHLSPRKLPSWTSAS